MRSVLILFSLLCALMVVFSLPLGPTSNLENSQPNKITTLANTLADPPAAEEPAAEAPAAEEPAAEAPAAEEPAAEAPAAEDPPAKGPLDLPLLGDILKLVGGLLDQILGGLL
ncbi:hypothetical protein G6F57_009835 [Rhizopus arrhizus]|nr:hypothetical protein G6F30_001871 [Rhizopus arrhizus]KAG0988070.1 hypothetical protein G6F29_002024 [Rhizopus arrhizus]KAG1000110.1 hypothetical protein G6F28_000368 [Rhizopus arrhizus]KAG1013200.1 hypothetical protein G6F27_002107 [Rhizopus arrhizus]KAG1029221.1 hypothetical protein G6F26_001928 [Rhizopus arrhizus]